MGLCGYVFFAIPCPLYNPNLISKRLFKRPFRCFHSQFSLPFSSRVFLEMPGISMCFSHLFSPKKDTRGCSDFPHGRPRPWSCRRWRRCYTCGWVIWWSVRWKMRRRCFAWVGWWFDGWMVVGWWLDGGWMESLAGQTSPPKMEVGQIRI